MSIMLNNFFILPFWFRSAVLVFLLLFLLWKLVGKIIFWILSIIPFLIEKIFKYFYLFIEIPVAFLHKKFGASFYVLDNKLSQNSEKVERAIHCWYEAWHFSKKKSFKKFLITYILCIFFILVPYFTKTNNSIFKIGEKAYIYGETFLVNLLGVQGLERLKIQDTMEQNDQLEIENVNLKPIEAESLEITLIVSVKSSLLVRDIPSIENCVILDQLDNNDEVIWRGQMVFAEAEGEHIEPWVKIETKNGVEGWSRLFYLYPEQYKNLEFLVTE